MCSFVSLTSLLQKLPLNKAPGPDCISAEHLLYADQSLRFFLSELFKMCIVRGYMPNSCLNTTIVPICKNKNGNMSDTSNYRPVAVATVVSKLLEHFILSSISPFLGTTGNQFGFWRLVIVLLQPLRWCCIDCVIHHERDVREEQHHTYMWREQAIKEWSWHVISGDTNDVNDWT